MVEDVCRTQQLPYYLDILSYLFPRSRNFFIATNKSYRGNSTNIEDRPTNYDESHAHGSLVGALYFNEFGNKSIFWQ